MKLKTLIFLSVLALTMVIQLRSVYSMTEEELEASQSVSSSHTPKSAAAFEDYFKRVVRYGVLPVYRDQEPIRTYKIEGGTIREDQGQNKNLILQHLIELAPSLSHF